MHTVSLLLVAAIAQNKTEFIYGSVKSAEKTKTFVVTTTKGELSFKYSATTPVFLNREKAKDLKEAFAPETPVWVSYFGTKEPYTAKSVYLFKDVLDVRDKDGVTIVSLRLQRFDAELSAEQIRAMRGLVAVHAFVEKNGISRYYIVPALGQHEARDFTIKVDEDEVPVPAAVIEKGHWVTVKRGFIEAVAKASSVGVRIGSDTEFLFPQELDALGRFLTAVDKLAPKRTYDVQRKADPFDGDTELEIELHEKLRLKVPDTSDSIQLTGFISATVDKGEARTVLIGVSGKFSEWKMLKLHDIKLVADGARIELEESRHSGDVVNNGVIEVISGRAAVNQLDAIGKASSVGIRIGVYEGQIPKDEIPAFKAMADSIRAEIDIQKNRK